MSTLARGDLPEYGIRLDERLRLVEAVTVDGERRFWLRDLTAPPGSGAVNAPHEQLGPLPREWKRACGLVCGAPSKTTGEPCRIIVKHPDDCCPRHQEADR